MSDGCCPTLYVGMANSSESDIHETVSSVVNDQDTEVVLSISADDMSRFDALPLARFLCCQSESADGQTLNWKLDDRYCPPVLHITAWADLYDALRGLLDYLTSRSKVLAQVVRESNLSMESVRDDLQQLHMLNLLNESVAELSCLLGTQGLHPLIAYTCLCRVAGRCAVNGPTRLFEPLPGYDHEDLAYNFRIVLERIRKLVGSTKKDECQKRYFVGTGRSLVVQLNPEWLRSSWELYFGIELFHTSREQALVLLKDKLHWKLGSPNVVQQYVKRSLPGVKVRPVKDLPRALPNQSDWIYFRIKQEDETWDEVKMTHNLAIWCDESQIANLSTLEGARTLRLSVDGKIYAMEFALFAVHRGSPSR